MSQKRRNARGIASETDAPGSRASAAAPTGPAAETHGGTGALPGDPEQLLAEYGITAEDLRLVKKIAPLLEKQRHDFVEAFYERILASPEQKQFFASPEVLRRVKELQERYFLRLWSGRYDREYVADRAHVGQIHSEAGLPIAYFLSALNFYRNYVARIITEQVEPKPVALATLSAVDKIIQLDGAIVTQTYLEARERTIREQSRSMLELSTPVVRIWEGILLVPLIGTIDTPRAQQIVERLLTSIVETESGVAIVDVTGVPIIDTRVAGHLARATVAAKLLGAKVLLSGISSHIAQTLTRIDLDLSTLHTCGTLRDALHEAFRRTGLRVRTDQEG